MNESDSKFSAAALDEFLRYLGDKGLMAKPTVAARRAACSKMLGVLSSDEQADLRELDIDSVATRFANLEGRNYTPDSLKTYKSRASKAIADFLDYLDNPAGFKPKISASRKPVEKQPPREPEGSRGPEGNGVRDQVDQSPRQPEVKKLSVPIPIREDIIVTVDGLPFDLSSAEAKRIANVIMAMAVVSE